MHEKITRSTVSEVSASTEKPLQVTGYAAVFDSYAEIPAENFDYEIIDRGAFDNADFSRCVFRYNHSDTDQLLARVSNDTLKLSVDDTGLKVDAILADTQQGRDLYTLIKRKDVRSMSFCFIAGQTYIQNNVRHIKSIDAVFDVSAVDDPAYPATTLEVIEQRSKEAAAKKAESEKRKRLFLLCC